MRGKGCRRMESETGASTEDGPVLVWLIHHKTLLVFGYLYLAVVFFL